MTEFVKVIDISGLAPGSGMEAMVSGRPIALFNVDGTFYAIGNTCVHRGGPLGQGMLDGLSVMCPWHAWSYDITTGLSSVNPDLRVPRYEVKVEDGQVWVRPEPL
jgi:nitrite reductase/ring-hydroxylating ferredoxin subunit